MKQELVNRRKLSYLINIWDDVNLPYKIDYTDIDKQVIKFFNTQSELIYPAKSYFVAIVYAKCFEKYFNESFYEVLSDKDLLPDDRFFKTYLEDKKTYDIILSNIKDSLSYKSSEKTINYFKKEFLIGTDN